ncbi:transmembrane protein 255B-like [Salarias fasciatus]|uniref:transmembrane protein 255B-like n=1 Tax=Salarias fasciatus TaxID=181472 RepID=UPI001176FEC5|nr:transmembrane protein 255B-like [Salarias fasciatus]
MTVMVPGAAGRSKPASANPETELKMRVRRASWLVLGMLTLSLLLVLLGIYTTTRTESLHVTGYASGVILTLGSFVGLLGLRLEENRRQLLRAAMFFLSLGVICSFLCLLIDGVCTALNLDMRPLKAGRCQHYSSGNSYMYENFYTSVSCWTLQESCTLTVRSGTCYCCDLYDCANGGYLSNYYEFVGVQSCDEVFVLYVSIWILSGLNLVAFFMGILVTAVLGSIKVPRCNSPVTDLSESAASSPTAPLLMDANLYKAHRLHPLAPGFIDPGEKTAASSSVPLLASPPPPFAPLSSLPPYRDHDLPA